MKILLQIHMYVCIFVCRYACMYVMMYIYIYIHVPSRKGGKALWFKIVVNGGEYLYVCVRGKSESI
jgi:hypothetical protein